MPCINSRLAKERDLGRLLRLIPPSHLFAEWNSSATENLSKLNWLTLDKKRKENIAVMMHKILSGRALDYLIEKFSFREHGHNTRSGLVTFEYTPAQNRSNEALFCVQRCLILELSITWTTTVYLTEQMQTDFDKREALNVILLVLYYYITWDKHLEAQRMCISIMSCILINPFIFNFW